MIGFIKNYPPPYVKSKAAINDRYITDPITAVVTELISSWRWLTPTAVTLVGFAFACGACYLFLDGMRSHQLWGALLWEVNYLLDGVDGKLARKRNEFSPYGAWLDAQLDKVKKLGALAALIVAEPTHWMAMLALVMVHYALNRIDYPKSKAVTDWVGRNRLRAVFDPLDQLFILLLLGPLLGMVFEALILVVILQLAVMALHAILNKQERLVAEKTNLKAL